MGLREGRDYREFGEGVDVGRDRSHALREWGEVYGGNGGALDRGLACERGSWSAVILIGMHLPGRRCVKGVREGSPPRHGTHMPPAPRLPSNLPPASHSLFLSPLLVRVRHAGGGVTPFWGPPPLATPQAAAAATPHGGRSPSPSWPLPFMGKRAAVSWGAAQPPKLLELALELALLRCSTDRAQHTDTSARAGVCSARITSAAPRAQAGPPNCDGENNCTADAFCE